MEQGQQGPFLMDDAEYLPVRLSKSQYQEIAEDTVACCGRGWYTNGAGEQVDLPLAEALESTRLHPAGATLPRPPKGQREQPGGVSVVRASTLGAARALVSQGLRVAVLNFASAKNPGGGFLRGANAQEESLARVSGLHACLTKPEVHAFYADNETERSCIYTDSMIMSPAVPVFKAEDGQPLDAPYSVGFLTVPAPNFGVAAERAGAAAVRAARRRRMHRLLSLLAAEDFDAVVLGAWGCGVFANDPAEVAAEFDEMLRGDFRGMLPQAVFAILDEGMAETFRGVFAGVRPAAPARGSAAAASGAKPKGSAAPRWGKAGQGAEKADRKKASLAKKSAGGVD